MLTYTESLSFLIHDTIYVIHNFKSASGEVQRESFSTALSSDGESCMWYLFPNAFNVSHKIHSAFSITKLYTNYEY